MALITCPECGREKVSDTAESCPDCGYNINKHFQKVKQSENVKYTKEVIDSGLSHVKKTPHKLLNVGKQIINKIKEKGKTLKIPKIFKKPVFYVAFFILILLISFISCKFVYSNNPFKKINPYTKYSLLKRTGLVMAYGKPDEEKGKESIKWENVKCLGLDGKLEVRYINKTEPAYNILWYYKFEEPVIDISTGGDEDNPPYLPYDYKKRIQADSISLKRVYTNGKYKVYYNNSRKGWYVEDIKNYDHFPYKESPIYHDYLVSKKRTIVNKYKDHIDDIELMLEGITKKGFVNEESSGDDYKVTYISKDKENMYTLWVDLEGISIYARSDSRRIKKIKRDGEFDKFE